MDGLSVAPGMSLGVVVMGWRSSMLSRGIVSILSPLRGISMQASLLWRGIRRATGWRIRLRRMGRGVG